MAHLLDTSTPAEISKVLNARGPLLERALDASRQLVEGEALVRPAWQRYNGVVWSHLDPSSLADRQRRRILVPSAVYGLTSGTDPVADYRLTLKVSLGSLGNLGRFWRATLARTLDEMTGAQFVSFLPKEHSTAIGDSAELSRRMVTVSFLRYDGEGVAGHDAKAAKGIVARRVLEDGLGAVEDFEWRGWRGEVRHGQYCVRAPKLA